MSAGLREARAAVLQALNPGLKRPASDDYRTGLVAAAQNMRLELAAAFPGVKFSVRSSRFSGGDSISVRWVDGPCTVQVEEIVGKYERGRFSGVDDSYTYSQSPWPLAFGGAKYVMTARDYSPRAIEAAIRRVWARYGADLEAAGVERPGYIDYESGRLFGQASHVIGYDDLASLVSRELQRHTAFAKPAAVLARWPDMAAEESEAAPC